jgi:cytidylate kinase
MKIAITGKMCSGKSTIANIIKQLNPNYNIYSYAEKIKEIAIELFNMKFKDRTLLIEIANKMKSIDEDIWAKYLMKQLKNKKNCVIDDLRFQNELDLLDDNWTIINLNIDYLEQKKRIQNLYPNNYKEHFKNMSDISETQNLDFKGKNVINFDTSKDKYEHIKHTLFTLLVKNN